MIKLEPKKITRINDEKKETIENSLIQWLCQEVELSPDFTLENLFYFIKQEKDMINIVFYSHIGGFPIEAYIEEIEKDITPNNDYSDLDELEMGWYTEYYADNILNSFEIYTALSGNQKKPNGDNETYSISFSPLNEIKNIPLRLNKTIIINDDINASKGAINTILLKSYKNITLYDFLSCILHEISFYGYPGNRDKIIKELDNNIKNEEFTNLNEFDNVEDLFKDLEKDD